MMDEAEVVEVEPVITAVKLATCSVTVLMVVAEEAAVVAAETVTSKFVWAELAEGVKVQVAVGSQI